MKLQWLDRFRVYPFVLFLFLFGGISVGNTQGIDPCEQLRNAQAILNCVVQNHPEVKRNQADLEITQNSEAIAKQRPNPEIDSRILFGLTRSNEEFLSEINLGHIVELGGKRRRRIEQSQARQQVAVTNIQETREKVILETVVALYRLRQIRSEIGTVQESLGTFQKILRLYRQRPLLDPEQQASQSTFQLAEKDLLLKSVSLREEEIELKSLLEKAVGRPIRFSSALFPSLKKQWPKFSSQLEIAELQGATLQKAKAELEYAKASEKLVQSEAKPNLKIGPSIDTSVTDGKGNTSFGFNFSLPLPLFHQNQGQKREAFLQQQKAKLNLELLQKEKGLERQRLLEAYNRLVKVLKLSEALSSSESRHQEIEKLFEKGFIPSALILETHRQLIESKEKFHQLELKAIEALWRIYALEGRILEERL